MSGNPYEARYTEMRGLFDVALPDTRPPQYHVYPGATGDDVQTINAAFENGITPTQISDDCAQGVNCLGNPLDAYQYASARYVALTGESTIVSLFKKRWLEDTSSPIPACQAFKDQIFGSTTPPGPTPPPAGGLVIVQDFTGGGEPLPGGPVVLATVKVPQDGGYHVSAFGGVRRDPAPGFFVMGIRKNGLILGLGTVGFALRIDTDTQAHCSADLACVTGDVLDVFVNQVSGVSLTAGPSGISAFLLK